MYNKSHNTLGIVFLIGFLILVGITLFALKSLADIPPIQKIKFEHGYKLEETSPQADGKIHGTARISPAPVYYKKNGQFVSLQAGFVDKGNGVYEMADAPINVKIPKVFNGNHLLTSDNAKSWQMNPVGANNVTGKLVDIGTDFDGNHQNKLVFQNAFNGVDVEINPFWGGYETTYTINDPAVTDVHFDAEPVGNTLITHGNKALDVQEDGAFIGFIPAPTAHDKNGLNVPVTEIDTTVGAGKLITYTVNATSSLQYPIKLDPLVRICSTSVSGPCQQKITVDGELSYYPTDTHTTWANIIAKTNVATQLNSTAADSTDHTNSLVCFDTGDPGYDILGRVIVQFDTGSVGATSFSSSSLIMKEAVTRDVLNNSPDRFYAPSALNSSSTNALITTDFRNASDTRAADLIAFPRGADGNWDSTSQADDFLIYATQTTNILNGGGTPTTTAKFMFRCSRDYDASDPGRTADLVGVGFHWSETASTADSPQLIADYTAPATAAPFNDDNSSFFILLLKEIKRIFAGAIQAYIPS